MKQVDTDSENWQMNISIIMRLFRTVFVLMVVSIHRVITIWILLMDASNLLVGTKTYR